METKTIHLLLQENPRKVSVFVDPEKGDPRGKNLEGFARDLASQGLSLALQDQRNRQPEERPSLAFSSGDRLPRHFYQALPDKLEWGPFYNLLRTLASGKISLSPDSLETLKKVINPLTIRVLITPSCPFCSQVVGLVNQLAAACPLLTAWIIDVDLFPEWARQYKVKAVPVTILGEEVILSGSLTEKALVGWLAKMDSQDYLDQLYRNDLLEKRMDLVVARIKKNPQDLPIIAGLIQAEEFGIKLGAMAVIEQVSEEAPGLHPLIFEALLPLFEASSDQILGDSLFLMGPLKDQRKVPILRNFLSHANPEIAEAAREGLTAA
jgi:hypothetical protein